MSPTYNAFLELCMFLDRHLWIFYFLPLVCVWAFVGGLQRFFDHGKKYCPCHQCQNEKEKYDSILAG